MAANEQHHVLPRPSFDKPVKLLIVVAPYYKEIADNLVAGAKAEIEAVGGTWDLVEVPGALEVPTAIGIADRRSNFDGYVAVHHPAVVVVLHYFERLFPLDSGSLPITGIVQQNRNANIYRWVTDD